MAQAMRGLKFKPNYEGLINVAVSDKLYNVEFPNGDASFLRNGFVLSQLDGEGMRAMERQQELASKESYKEHLLKEIAQHTGANTHDLRNDSHQELRAGRVEKALHFAMSKDDGVPMTQTYSTCVQAEAQTSPYGVQAEAQTRPSGTQSPKTEMDEFGRTQTTRIKTQEKGNQATEDPSEEIEQLRHASELEKQALIDQYEQNTERIRQQVKAEADAEHSRQKEGYKQEIMQQSQINEAKAQIIINQVHQQAQQDAQHAQQYAGSVINFAEQAHIIRLG